MHFAVLGAGVVGLNTALELKLQWPAAKVTILAERFTTDTTSDVAAGIFWPGTGFSGPTDALTRQWIKVSYEHWKRILDSADAEKAGIRAIDLMYFSNINEENVRNELFKGVLPEFGITPNSMHFDYRPPGCWKYGSHFSTLLTDCRCYLPWATAKFLAAGGEMRSQLIASTLQAFLDSSDTPRYTAIFNCTGLGARQLVGDKKLIPIRGQVLRVHAPWIPCALFDDFDTYIIPTVDGQVVLGGMRQYDNWCLAADRHDRAAILERCERLCPGVAQAPVVREQVGLRPYRHEVRVEAEWLRRGCGRDQLVVHNYGHGGYGVTTSPGTAKYAVGLAQEALRESQDI